jgi:hypothetical protein
MRCDISNKLILTFASCFLALILSQSSSGQGSALTLTTGYAAESFIKYNSYEEKHDETFSIGFQYSFQPKNGAFEWAGGVHYFSSNTHLLFPLTFNLRFGKKMKFRFGGGPVPFIRLNYEGEGKTIALGGKLATGLALQVTDKSSVFLEYGFFAIPQVRKYYSAGGASGTDRYMDYPQFIHLGFRYRISKLKD